MATWISDDKTNRCYKLKHATEDYVLKILESYLDNYDELFQQYNILVASINNWNISFEPENNSIHIVGDLGSFEFDASQKGKNAKSKEYNFFRSKQTSDGNVYTSHQYCNLDTRGEGEYHDTSYDPFCEHQDYPYIEEDGFILNGTKYVTCCNKHAAEGVYRSTISRKEDGFVIDIIDDNLLILNDFFYDFIQKELDKLCDENGDIDPEKACSDTNLKKYEKEIKNLDVKTVDELGDEDVFLEILDEFEERIVDDFKDYFNKNYDETKLTPYVGFLEPFKELSNLLAQKVTLFVHAVKSDFEYTINLSYFADKLPNKDTFDGMEI